MKTKGILLKPLDHNTIPEIVGELFLRGLLDDREFKLISKGFNYYILRTAKNMIVLKATKNGNTAYDIIPKEVLV